MKLELKDYPVKDAICFGKLVTFDIAMDTFPDKRMRTIRVYLPESYDGVKRFPVMYMHDAQNLFTGAGVDEFKWYVDRVMRDLEPTGIQVIFVGIDTSDDRGSELFPPYTQNATHRIPHRPGTPEPTAMGHYYADFVKNTLKPLIDENFMTLPDAANTGIGGASMGGLQSFYMTMRDPDVFGRSLIFSPAFSLLDDDSTEIIDGYDAEKLKDVRMYIFTGDQGLDATILYPATRVYRRLKDELGLSRTQVAFIADSRETHYMTTWHKYLADSLLYLYSEDNSRPEAPAHTQRPPRGDEE